MPSRSQRHLREHRGVDSGGTSVPGITAVRNPTSVSVAAAATATITITLTRGDGTALPGALVSAASANTARFTIGPGGKLTDSLGRAVFTVTGVANGAAVNATFTSSTDATITAVAVTVTA